jgi:hypothetical protein
MVSALEMSSDISGTSHCVVWRKEWIMNQACGDMITEATGSGGGGQREDCQCQMHYFIFRSSHSPYKAQIVFFLSTYHSFDPRSGEWSSYCLRKAQAPKSSHSSRELSYSENEICDGYII